MSDKPVEHASQLKLVQKQKVSQIRPKDREFLKVVGLTIKKALREEYTNAVIMYFDEEGEAMWLHINEGEYYKTMGLISDNMIKYSLQEMLSHVE